MDKLSPIHPGEVLREEFLHPLGIHPDELAKRIGLATTAIESWLDEKLSLTPEIALRLGRFFTTTPEFWLNLQRHFDLEGAKERIGEQLEKIEPRKNACTD